jgi:glycosyltransferase involved in cell wall biosynthesis
MIALGVVIPARNEARRLPATLRSVQRAAAAAACDGVDVVVVDNDSADGTATVARAHGARVLGDHSVGIARVRNAGARAVRGDVLVFLDADTTVPDTFLARVAATMADPGVIAGAPVVEHVVTRCALQAYLDGWAVLARTLGMVQGAGQFVRRDAFDAVGGYDETIYMGEDVELFWRLRRDRAGRVVVLDDVVLRPSPRRFEVWPLWRTLLFTNPLVIRTMMRTRWFWRGWYGLDRRERRA